MICYKIKKPAIAGFFIFKSNEGTSDRYNKTFWRRCLRFRYIAF